MSDRGRLMWQMCACGGDDEPTEVEIAGSSVRVQLFGLKRAFRQLLSRGLEPVESTAEQLLTMIKAENRVPRSEEQAYKVALLREYALFCEKANLTESSFGGPSRSAS